MPTLKSVGSSNVAASESSSKDCKKRLQSLRTKSKVPNLNTVFCVKSFKYNLVKRIDLKSEIPPIASVNSVSGILN